MTLSTSETGRGNGSSPSAGLKTCCAPGVTPRPERRIDIECSCRTGAAASVVGMRRIPGGRFRMGSAVEAPIHEVTIDPFYLDAACVTNEQFNEFVNQTGHKTEAEQQGWAFVFVGHLSAADQRKASVAMVDGATWWRAIEGATWRHPEGPGSNIKKRWRHPVVQLSWHDAWTFAKWKGKRLPTEAEWEFAARGGLEQQPFPWGDELEPAGEHRMNVWQGTFPTHNTEADGYYGTAPARSFPPNAYGLYNMTGNVWEWCSDWFDPNYYKTSPAANPAGPSSGERRVIRGGSYLCHASYCSRYRTDARYSNTPDSATTNCGFRCALSI